MRLMTRLISFLMLVIAFAGGCSSYQDVPIAKIEAKPQSFVNKKALVHFDGTIPDSTVISQGRSQRPRHKVSEPTAPDSVVAVRIMAINYPVISGPCTNLPKMYGETAPPDTFSLNLKESRRVEIHSFSPAYTCLLLFGAFIIVGIITGGSGSGDWNLGPWD